jgi:hypothetical protein
MDGVMQDIAKLRIRELTAEAIAAELNLTFFASRYGKESPTYRDSLRDFATAWYLLKKNRHHSEFHKDVKAS